MGIPFQTGPELYVKPKPMRRRTFLPTLLGATLPLSAWAQARPQPARPPGHFVPASALQQAVNARFPLRYPIAGMLDLDVQSPRLRWLPAQNRLGADLTLQASGAAFHRAHTGQLSLDFGLRYEASDRSIRAHRLRLDRMDFPSLQPGVVELLNRYGPALAEQALDEVVLHTLSAQDLALPDRLGLQPGDITVVADGLVVGMVAKPLS
jgi:hypothetical protein